MKYICTSLAMVFCHLSPMVYKRMSRSERNMKSQLKYQSLMLIDEIKKKLLNIQSSHFIPLKWALHVVDEAQEKGEINARYVGNLIAEINTIHTQCDRLVSFKHEFFSKGLTYGVTTSIFAYFVVGTVSFTKFASKNEKKCLEFTDSRSASSFRREKLLPSSSKCRSRLHCFHRFHNSFEKRSANCPPLQRKSRRF